jgi:hypothetical protein
VKVTIAYEYLYTQIRRFGSLRILLVENLDQDGWVSEPVRTAQKPIRYET